MIKTIHHTLGACALISAPALAIEPPTEHLPIPPQAAPAEPRAVDPEFVQERERAGNRDRVEPAEQRPGDPVPMPEGGEARPFLGIILDPLPDLLASHLKLDPGQGVMILEALADGPAEKAGLKPHDVIVEVDGQGVGSVQDVREVTAAHKVGDKIPVVAFHEGERREFEVELGAAPEAMAAPPRIGGAGMPGGNEPFLEGLPEKHADMIREALERNLQAFENPAGDNLGGDLERQLMERMREMQGRLGNLGNLQMKMGGGVESSVRLLDDQGSIEMKTRDGSRQAKVYDQDGNLIWEGPYDTEQDKAAVPDEIRERLERLNFDIGEGGIQMRLNQERFRRLDDLEPKHRDPGADLDE